MSNFLFFSLFGRPPFMSNWAVLQPCEPRGSVRTQPCVHIWCCFTHVLPLRKSDGKDLRKGVHLSARETSLDSVNETFSLRGNCSVSKEVDLNCLDSLLRLPEYWANYQQAEPIIFMGNWWCFHPSPIFDKTAASCVLTKQLPPSMDWSAKLCSQSVFSDKTTRWSLFIATILLRMEVWGVRPSLCKVSLRNRYIT